MRIQLLSDLHIEHFDYKDELDELLESCLTNADVLILAGDIGVPGSLGGYDFWFHTMEFFCSNYPEIIYVPGNHEYYHSYWNRITNLLNEIKQPNLHIFEDMGSITLDETTFHCGTGWFVEANPMDALHWNRMSDAHVIFNQNMNERMALQTFWDKGKAASKYLLKNVNKGDIVVTHHMPHKACTPPQFSTSKMNNFFVNKAFEQVIIKNQPKLHLFGHTHNNYDSVIKNTRTVCNPLGYWKYEIKANEEFNRQLIIEI